MRILYVGETADHSTSKHRIDSLRRLGHEVMPINPQHSVRSHLLGRKMWEPIHFRTGYRFLLSAVRQNLDKEVTRLGAKPDLVWVNSGELLGRKSLEFLKGLGAPVVLYNNDDPTGPRDGNRFRSLLSALDLYDVCVVRKEESIAEFRRLGVRKIVRTWMSYDELIHQPVAYRTDEEKYEADLSFVGTWMRMEGRDRFLLDLIESGIDVAIWGPRWPKSKYYAGLKSNHRGGSCSGEAYVKAISRGKISLGLLSLKNRDQHTRRSVEIPYCGGLLCAERTAEHQMMYRDGEEAVFWGDADECIRKCKWLLENNEERERIRSNGMKRVRELRMGNEQICEQIIAAAFSGQSGDLIRTEHPLY